MGGVRKGIKPDTEVAEVVVKSEDREARVSTENVTTATSGVTERKIVMRQSLMDKESKSFAIDARNPAIKPTSARRRRTRTLYSLVQ